MTLFRWFSTLVASSLFVAMMGLAGAAQAGPWTREPGHLYAKVGGGVYTASEFPDATGALADDLRYTGWSTSLYAEVGLAPRLQLQAYVPWMTAATHYGDQGTHRRESIGDILVGLQFTPPGLRLPNAIQLDVKIPGYTLDGPTALRPQPGDGQVDITGSWSVGGPLPNLPLYAWGEIGYRHRTEWYSGERGQRNFGDAVVAGGQLGWQFGGRHFLMANVSAAIPWRDDIWTRGQVMAGPAIFLSVGAGFAVEASFDATLWARNSAQGYSGTIGVSFIR